MSTPQNLFSSIPSEEMSSVSGGVATATSFDPKLRPLLHLTHELSQLGQQQQQNQNQTTQTMLMAAVMARLSRG